jgi:hypothetical protein
MLRCAHRLSRLRALLQRRAPRRRARRPRSPKPPPCLRPPPTPLSARRIHRTLVQAGLQQYLKPEDLTGKLLCVVANLKPAKLAGARARARPAHLASTVALSAGAPASPPAACQCESY